MAIERTRLLEDRRAAELARQSEELKSALLASLGHDLRTPLTAIRVAATNLQQPLVDEFRSWWSEAGASGVPNWAGPALAMGIGGMALLWMRRGRARTARARREPKGRITTGRGVAREPAEHSTTLAYSHSNSTRASFPGRSTSKTTASPYTAS